MFDDVMKLAARILLAILFLASGLFKLADASAVAGMFGSMGMPAPTLIAYLVGICEVVGALAIVAGFQVRAVALLLAIWCVATALVAHLNMPLDLMKNLGLAGGLLLLAVHGAGSLAIGRKLGRADA